MHNKKFVFQYGFLNKLPDFINGEILYKLSNLDNLLEYLIYPSEHVP